MKRLVLYCFLVSISGCQKYYVLETAQQDGYLFFKSTEAAEKCRGDIYVVSLSVEYLGEKESRVAWDLVRKDSVDYSKKTKSFPIRYGEHLTRLHVNVPAMEILPGKYRIAAEVVCRSDGDKKSMLLFGSFLIDAERNLISTP